MYRAVLAVVSRILIFFKRSYSPMGWNFTLRVVLRHHGAIIGTLHDIAITNDDGLFYPTYIAITIRATACGKHLPQVYLAYPHEC